MKKILCSLFIILMFTAYPVFASEQMAQATITYTCDDSFFIEIPEAITVGDECTINAIEVNISPSKCVYVDLGHPDGYVRLYNEANENEYIDAYFKDGNGTTLTVTNLNLATFASGSGGSSQTFTTYIDDSTGKTAGKYSGVAMFVIHCD